MLTGSTGHRLGIFVAFAIAALVFGGCGSQASRAPGVVSTVNLDVGNRSRDYLFYLPQVLQGDPSEKALVVVLHGGGGTARQMLRETGEQFFRLAERDGFYVLFPNSLNKVWDFGAGRISNELDERVDDRSYFDAVLNDASDRYPIDRNRVFATGISRGGQASYFIACEFPGRIRAIAPVAMPLPAYMADACRNGPPFGIAIMNGTDDPLVPYDGGAITIGRRERDDVLGTAETVRLFGRRNGCSLSSTSESALDSAHDRTRVELAEWRDCTGAPILLYRIVGGGHTWPSGSQYLPKFVIGRVSKDIDGAEIAWSFFSEFR